ncbi:hypothetical protein QJS04_geneDACA014973 [Acorus gramineus]|uniref:Uncharacterized protein n=1 Tax=Acorus gramineus TaxID=55184 RepID=A0AAV9ANH9_ACOGR|nr:hypothetical protein QJS04_geneDACA014973 [Acorus gramineus]
MLLRKSINEAKKLIRKTIKSFQDMFFCSDYERLPDSPPPPDTISFSPWRGNKCRQNSFHDYHDIYDEFRDQQRTTNIKDNNKQLPNIEGHACHGRPCFAQTKQHEVARKVSGSTRDVQLISPNQESQSCISVIERLEELLERVDARDVEQASDIEEAICYYTRISCPLYVNIVHRFFMDTCPDLHSQVLPSPIVVGLSGRSLLK